MTGRPFRVLFLCTGNSARSQMAEALLNWKGKGRFAAESAGSRPASRVNPLAIATLRQYDIPWRGRAPRGIDGLEREQWDFVITVCDRAKEACPIFPGQPVLAHWGMPDPADAGGDLVTKQTAAGDRGVRRRVAAAARIPESRRAGSTAAPGAYRSARSSGTASSPRRAASP